MTAINEPRTRIVVSCSAGTAKTRITTKTRRILLYKLCFVRFVRFVPSWFRPSSRSQRDLLYSPVRELADEQLVLAAAVDGVHHVELFRQPAGAAELADDLSVELELVDLAVVERLRVVRVRRVEILVRAGRDADRRRHANIRDLRLRRPAAVEDLNPLVAGVGDVDVALRVEGDAAQRVELPDVAAALSPR